MLENDFYKKVYVVVRKVPFGRVTTYGAIARFIGSPSSSRVVGWALNSSHNDSSIPAHRVVNRNGLLSAVAILFKNNPSSGSCVTVTS